MPKKHSPPKRTYKMLGRYDVEHGDLMKWGKRIIMVGALATAISGLGFNLEWPFYPRIDGVALAQSVQQLYQTQGYLLGKSYASDRKDWCAQAQIALIRLDADRRDEAAASLLAIARDRITELNQQLHYPPPPPNGPPC